MRRSRIVAPLFLRFLVHSQLVAWLGTRRGRTELGAFQPGFDIVLGADLIYSPKVVSACCLRARVGGGSGVNVTALDARW